MKQIIVAVSLVACLILVGLSVTVLYLVDAQPQITSPAEAPQKAIQEEPVSIVASAGQANAPDITAPKVQEAAETAKTTPAPVKPQKPAAQPVEQKTRFTVEMVTSLRAEALERRKAEREAALQKERSDHQWKVDWALRDEADAVFDSDHRDIASEFRTDCRDNDADACAALAQLYAKGRRTDLDARLALSLRFVSCAAKSDTGCLAYSETENLPTGEDVSNNPHISHFQTRCGEGHAAACAALATEYRYGFGVLEQDKERGNALYAQACELGSPSACKMIGNKDRALSLYQAACAADDPSGCSSAASLVQKTDAEQHLSLREKACALAPEEYCLSLGTHLAKDGGTPADQKRATEVLINGCEAGNQGACWKASDRLAQGLGAPTDKAAAELVLRKGCARGLETHRCTALLTMPFVDLDPTSAEAAAKIGQTADVAALSQSCRADNADACRALSEAHGGLDTPEASFVATQLIARACALGDATACLRQLNIGNWDERHLHSTRLCAEGVPEACVIQIETDPALDGEVKYQQMVELCEGGNPHACGGIAEILAGRSSANRAGVQVDLQRAFELNKQACIDGSGIGCVNYGRAIDPDIDDDKYSFAIRDEAEALGMYERACELGFAYGCSTRSFNADRAKQRDIAIQYGTRACSIQPFYCSPLKRLLLLQERDALNGEIGVLTAALSDRPHDFFPQTRAAGARARAGCQADVSQACIEFGHLIYGNYSGGMDGTVAYDAADRTWARAAYLHACELGDALACHIFAHTHDGIGEESEPLIALANHKRACEMGFGASCARAGFYYKLGSDVPEDDKAASDLYMKGCTQGDTYSCKELSGMYELQDEGQKAEYDVIACVNGKSFACEFASDDFDRGRNGVPKSKRIATLLREVGCEEDEDCGLN